MNALELFAGAGGLGMGVSLAGFKPLAVVEWDKWACDTIRENIQRGHPLVSDWPLYEGDVRKFDYSAVDTPIDLLSGGPPCQPFSMGGKHKGFMDDRDMFPAAINAVNRLRPRAFLIENVKGITRPAFANYLQYILLQLSYPELSRKPDEQWIDHLARLERHKTSGAAKGLHYRVVCRVINAADYGIPQKRERIFIVGFRADQKLEWNFPNPTHSLDALLFQQWVTGEYWDAQEVSKKQRPAMTPDVKRKLARLKKSPEKANRLAPWNTVRTALKGLPDPVKDSSSKTFLNHRYQAGARVYPGHTGSPLDLPAKTLKAGDHGVPGGENMMVLTNGEVRYFTVREAARLQTFPDGYVFHGSWTETMRQLGNAVPVALAQLMASSVAMKLAENRAVEIANQVARPRKAS